MESKDTKGKRGRKPGSKNSQRTTENKQKRHDNADYDDAIGLTPNSKRSRQTEGELLQERAAKRARALCTESLMHAQIERHLKELHIEFEGLVSDRTPSAKRHALLGQAFLQTREILLKCASTLADESWI